jgi:hypothetical protein
MSLFADTTFSPVYTECAFKAGVWSGDTPPTEFFDPANFTSIEITPVKQDKIQVLSNIEGSIGESLGTVFKSSAPAAFKGILNTFNKTLAQIILGADVIAISRTGAAVTDEAVTTVLNMWVPLANSKLASTPAFVLETAGTPDVVIDAAKYEVDLELGMVRAIHADAVGTKKATYTTATIAGNTFQSGKAKTTRLKLIGTCTDKFTGQRGQIVLERVAVVSDQAIDLVKQEAMQGTLMGDLETPTGASSPWTFKAFT